MAELCAVCGRSLRDEARYCGYCGTPVPRALLSARPEWQTAVARLAVLATGLERTQVGLQRARAFLAAPGAPAGAPGADASATTPLQPEAEADALWKARLQLDLVASRLVRQTADLGEVCQALAELAAASGGSKKT